MALEMTVPVFRCYSPSLSEMNSAQAAFYEALVPRLDRGEYIDVEGSISYLFVYIYELIRKGCRSDAEGLRAQLIRLSELYSSEARVPPYCLHWANDCLLGLTRYEEYLDETEPLHPYGTATGPSNLRLNLQARTRRPAHPVDLVRLVGCPKSAFIGEQEAAYRAHLFDVFTRYALDNGGDWFEILRRYQSHKKTFPHHLFCGAPIRQPLLKFELEDFHPHPPLVRNIRVLAAEAENRARESTGLRRIQRRKALVPLGWSD